jgi:hypothetical protein
MLKIGKERIGEKVIEDNKIINCHYEGQKVIAQVGLAYKNDSGTIIIPIKPAKNNHKTKPTNVALKNLQFDSCRTKCRLEKQIRAKLNGSKKEKKVA